MILLRKSKWEWSATAMLWPMCHWLCYCHPFKHRSMVISSFPCRILGTVWPRSGRRLGHGDLWLFQVVIYRGGSMDMPESSWREGWEVGQEHKVSTKLPTKSEDSCNLPLVQGFFFFPLFLFLINVMPFNIFHNCTSSFATPPFPTDVTQHEELCSDPTGSACRTGRQMGRTVSCASLH